MAHCGRRPGGVAPEGGHARRPGHRRAALRATAAGPIRRLGAMLAQSSDESSREHLHASLALLPVDASQVDYLFKRLLDATPSELPVLRDALKPHRSTLTPKLWTVLESAKPGDPSLLASAGALASYDPG